MGIIGISDGFYCGEKYGKRIKEGTKMVITSIIDNPKSNSGKSFIVSRVEGHPEINNIKVDIRLVRNYYNVIDELGKDSQPQIEKKNLEKMMDEKITLEKLQEIVNEIDAEYQGTKFQIFMGDHEGNLWVQVGTMRPDTYTQEMGIGKGGKAYVSEFATHDEVVKKIFGLCMAYVEHETREGFKWRGRRIFNPHVKIEALWSVALKSNWRK